MVVSIVAAMAENRAIGKDGRIPWYIKEDLIRVRNLTSGHVVILGRKTYESMLFYYNKSGKSFPGKLYIVVTTDKNYKPERNNITAGSIKQALEIAKENEEDEIFIIGGQHVFEQTINIADKLYLTIVEGNFQGDTFFPDYSDFKKLISEKKGKSEGYKYKFLVLLR